MPVTSLRSMFIPAVSMLALLALGCGHITHACGCKGASEAACQASSVCEPQYGARWCGPPGADGTTEEVYKGCEALEAGSLDEVRAAFASCQATPGGVWSRRDEAVANTPKTGHCGCRDERNRTRQLLSGERRIVVRAAEAGFGATGDRELDEGVRLSPNGKPACQTMQEICELNGGSWVVPPPKRTVTQDKTLGTFENSAGCQPTHVYEITKVDYDRKECVRDVYDWGALKNACHGVTLLRSGDAHVVVDTRPAKNRP